MTVQVYNMLDMQPTDELEMFAGWFMRERPLVFTPENGMMFVESACGTCLFRHENLQVELFLISPNADIPEHIHPNIDSIEIAMWGMRFSHSGQIVMDFEHMDAARGFGIRVRPGDWHGGKASPSGACFLSVQRWLNEVPPTTVVNDWSGDVLGKQHLGQITSGAAVPQQINPETSS
jgi:hypothetical protein